MNTKYIFDYTYLAEASYTDFSQPGNVYLNLTSDTNGNKSEAFANLVTQNYTVEAHWKDRAEKASDPESGFSATLFRGTDKSGQEGKYI